MFIIVDDDEDDDDDVCVKLYHQQPPEKSIGSPADRNVADVGCSSDDHHASPSSPSPDTVPGNEYY